jgi:hypothetical protein
MKSKVSVTALAASNLVYLTDVERKADTIEQNIDEALQLLKVNLKETAKVFFNVDQKDIKKSPSLAESPFKLKTNLKALEKNYRVVLELTTAMDALNTLEGKLKTSIAPTTRGFDVSMVRIQKLKKATQEGLTEAYEFLNHLAEKHVPAKFRAFVDALGKVISKSISYEAATTLMFVYTIGDGRLCFTQYIELRGLIDEKGKVVNSLFVLASFVPDTGEYYVNTLREFEPPSETVLGKSVQSMTEVLRTLNNMLEIDKFANNIGDLKLSDYMGATPNAKDFGFVKAVEADDGGMAFILRPTVRQDQLDSIVSDLYVHMKGLVSRTRAKLKVAVSKEDKHYVVRFGLTRNNASGDATENDLEFLRTRFHLNDHQLKVILKTINV